VLDCSVRGILCREVFRTAVCVVLCVERCFELQYAWCCVRRSELDCISFGVCVCGAVCGEVCWTAVCVVLCVRGVLNYSVRGAV
jgi:hypothetical protein